MSVRHTLATALETVGDESHLLPDERDEFGWKGVLGGVLNPELGGDVAATLDSELRDELSRVLHGLCTPLALDLLLQDGVLGWSLLAALGRLGRHGAVEAVLG